MKMPQDFKDFLMQSLPFEKDYPLFQEFEQCVNTIDALGAQSPSDLLNLLQDKKTDVKLRQELNSILTWLKYESVIPIFVQIGESKEEPLSLRRSALVNLFALDREKSFQILSNLVLFDLAIEIREMAASILHLNQTESCIHLLLKIMRNETAVSVRIQAIRGIGLIGVSNDRVGEELLAMLDNPNEVPRIRAYAAEAIGFLNYQPGVIHLIEHLYHPETSIRYMCTYSIGLLGNKSHLPLLGNLIFDTNIFESWGAVADAANEAMEEIKYRDQ